MGGHARNGCLTRAREPRTRAVGSGGRRCRIYDDRPDFCQVANLVKLFAPHELGSAAGDAFAIACCRQQIRSEYGGRGKVMRRFLHATRQRP